MVHMKAFTRTMTTSRTRPTNTLSSSPRRHPAPPRATPFRPDATYLDYTPTSVRLGQSDLVVPDICLGTMTWGKQNSEAEAHEQLSFAKDLGLTFLDTAEIYPVPTEPETQGRTEEYIGTWMKQNASSFSRDAVTIATKVAGYSPRLGYLREDGRGTRVTARDMEEALEKSLLRLGTDYVDLYQIHWPDRAVPLWGGDSFDPADAAGREDPVPWEEQLEGLYRLTKAGKIRAVGVSNETSYGVSAIVHAAQRSKDLPRVATIQNQFHLLSSGFKDSLAETCHELDVTLLPYSPLAGGVLTGKYQNGKVRG